jgi:hypothetical protein
MTGWRKQAIICTLLALLIPASSIWAEFIPWDPLVDDSWILEPGHSPSFTIHTVNGGDYTIAFYYARNDATTGELIARGMNSLHFELDGQNTGHLVSEQTSGSFNLQNTGDDRTFQDVLLLVAIDASSLPADFSMYLNLADPNYDPADPNTMDPSFIFYGDDFGYYDPNALGYDTGRPSGYYSATSPSSDPVSYEFERGMITIVAIGNAYLVPNYGTISIDYSFVNLPTRAVFSVYAEDPVLSYIRHTNRAFLDDYNTDPRNVISTFKVLRVIPGDVTSDWKVDVDDLSRMADYWLTDDPGDPNMPPLDIAPEGGDNIINYNDFGVLSIYWLVGTEME